MSFESFRERHAAGVEAMLLEVLRGQPGVDRSACAGMTAYHLETGGKRLRAMIPPYIYEAFGREPAEAYLLGAAVEMIHNATLVHDDLQDGDEVRRDRPTVWKRFSPAQAINCGDAMFQYAFLLLARTRVEPSRLARLVERAAGATLNVIEGQAQEFVMKDEPSPGVERYLSVVRGKTSGLFALPVAGSMEALGLHERAIKAAEKASMDLGMLFQIQDDLLDVYGDKGRKRAAADVAEGKISILVACVNDRGSAAEKTELAAILAKPRVDTGEGDVRRAIEIFEGCEARVAAVRGIREIQAGIEGDRELRECPEIRRVLLELGEKFLEPVNGLL